LAPQIADHCEETLLRNWDRATGSPGASIPGDAEPSEAHKHHHPGRRFGRGACVSPNREVRRKRRPLEPVEVTREPGRGRWNAGEQDHECDAFSSKARSETTIQFVSEPEASGPPRSTTIAPPTPIACPFASAVVLAARSAVFDVSKVASPNDGGSKSGAAIGLALMVSAANRRRQSARALNVGLGRQRIGKAVGRLADLSGACVGVGGGCEEGREAHGDELHRRSDILAPSAASLAAEILDLAGHLGSKVAQMAMIQLKVAGIWSKLGAA
jgi:hypothetical protein